MKYICLISMALILVMICACDSGATFEVHNRCAYPAWISVDNAPLEELIPGEKRSFKIDTGTENIFTGRVSESFPVIVYGETFTLEKVENGHLVETDSTLVEIQAGETRKAPLIANRASIKVTNNSSTIIERAEIWKHKGYLPEQVGALYSIAPGESSFKRVNYATLANDNMFYYTIRLYFPGVEEPLYYGNETTILGLDEQFHVIYTDPE